MATETKKLEWSMVTEPSVTSTTFRVDSNLTLSVQPASDNALTWHYLNLSFGRFEDRSLLDGQRLWPREAIQIARQKLDNFEAQLDARA